MQTNAAAHFSHKMQEASCWSTQTIHEKLELLIPDQVDSYWND